MLALALTVVLSQSAPAFPGPGAPKGRPVTRPMGAPSAYDSAKLFFLAGDIPAAQDWAQRGLKKEPKTCGPLNRLLAEYGFLLSQMDQPTPTQVRDFLALDRQISRDVRGKLTEKVYERFVTKPLQLARLQADGGGTVFALKVADEVLFLDPANAEALQLKGLEPVRKTYQVK